MMRAEWGKDLQIFEPTQAVHDWCKDHLRLPNPEFHRMQAMGKWTGRTPEYIVLYERRGGRLHLPFGCAREFYRAFASELDFRPVHAPVRLVRYDSSIALYPYQEEAVEAAMRLRNGVIVMPCGAGKTQTALELVARIGGRCLWLTHTQDLLRQSMDRAKAVLGHAGCGTITGGRVDIGQGITFATVQTMARLDLPQYEQEWDIIIVDECHKAVGSPTRVMQFYRVLSNLSCRYKFGITATPKRADGLEKSMFALLGDIICEVSRDAVAATTCPVEVWESETGWAPKDLDSVLSGDGTLNYAALVNDLVSAPERFESVYSVLAGVAGARGKTLVLGSRVEYLERLTERLTEDGLRAVCLSVQGTSKAAKAVRRDALRKLDAGELDCVLATYQLAKEGLDVPSLLYVVFATPEKDETTVTQAAGRVGRKAPGKEAGTIIDFVDSFGMYQGWAKKRRSIYRKMGYKQMY